MHFWKSYICSNTSDVQETDLGFTQFDRFRNHLIGRWIEIGRIPALVLWDLIVLVIGNTIQTQERTEQPVVNCDKDHGPNKRSQGMTNVLNNIDYVP